MVYGIPSGWSDPAVELVKAGWLDWKSCAQIANDIRAARLGDFSRNAVIGKVHRLGLSGTKAVVRRTASAPRVRAAVERARAPKPARAKPAGAPPPVLTLVEAAEKLGDTWPVGDAALPTLQLRLFGQCKFPVCAATGCHQLHCGDPAGENGVWCERHRLVVFKPSTPANGKSFERMFMREAGR